ncbi:MmyB family transcriptional regulator [Microbacterium sp. NPDC055903]
MFRLAGHSAPTRTDASPHVAPALMRVLDRLEDTPALILSDIGEALVANRLAIALFGDPAALDGHARSDVYRWFRIDGARDLYPQHDRARQSRALVANLRVAYGIQGPRSRAGALVRALLVESQEFAELWERQEVARRFEDHKVLIHPDIGPIELDCQVLFTEDQSQALLVLTAADATAAEQVRLLGVVGSERFSARN